VPGSTCLEDDAEMREIFIEEAREVVDNARAALVRLAETPESASDMTELRRAFHTLKGSSRMVGLREFGEAAWACEQVFNARLAHSSRMDGPLRHFTSEALTYLGDWTEAIAVGRDDGHRAPPVQQAADALRLENRRIAIAPPQLPLLAPEAAPEVGPEPEFEATPESEPAPLTPAESLPEVALEAAAVPGLADGALVQPQHEPLEEQANEPLEEPVHEPVPEPAPELSLDPEPPTQVTVLLPVMTELATPAQDVTPPVLDFDFELPEPATELETELATETALAADTAEPGALPQTVAEALPELGLESEQALPGVLAVPEASEASPAPEPPALDLVDFSFELPEPGPLQDMSKAASDEAQPLPTLDLPAEQADALPSAALVPDDDEAALATAAPAAPAAPDQPMLAQLADLIDRVPDLPSAADLDLGGLLPQPAIAEPPVSPFSPASPEESELSDLQLDLGAFGDEDTPVALEAPTSNPLPGSPPVEAGAAEELALDDEAIARLFDTGESASMLDPAPELAPESELQPEPEPLLNAFDSAADTPLEPASAAEADSEEPVKVIGDLRIGIPLFNIFLNEADEQSRRLCTETAEWALEHEQHGVPESSVALAHSLAGNSATVGFSDLSALARALEHALMRSQQAGHGRPGEAELFVDAAEEIRRLLHQFAAGFLRSVQPELMERLAEHERWPAPRHTEEAAADATELGVVDDALAESVPEAEAAVSLDDEALPAHLPLSTESEATSGTESQPEPEAEFEAEPEAEPEALRSATGSIFDSLSPVRSPVAGLSPVVVSDFLPQADARGAAGTGARADAFDDDEGIDAVDHIDSELWPIFEEEAEELLPQLQSRLRDWLQATGDAGGAAACMRTLHTLKGGARLAGAMRLGEMAHRLETAIEHLSAHEAVRAEEIEPLLARADAMSALFETLGRPGADAPQAAPPLDAPEPARFSAAGEASSLPGAEVDLELGAPDRAPAAVETEAEAGPAVEAPAEPTIEAVVQPAIEPSSSAPREEPPVPEAPQIDWSRFSLGEAVAASAPERGAGGHAAVRVRASLLDRLVNQAGEVSITRARIDADMRQLQGSLVELTDSLDRMRRQLRDIELQAETQMSSRLEAAKAASAAFDPLEMDRFTRFQELTRFMAESVNDVATLQRSLQRTLQSTEDELAAQARLTRELQDDLLRTRMVEFESLADRLYRTVRQAAKDAGKQVKLDIVGGAIEVDRGVLERMTAPFEHLLRNSVAHGIELPERRSAAGKEAAGRISITLTQAGNEVAVEFADDGAGLDLQRIRQRALEHGLLAPDVPASDAELAQLIFAPGFSTAEQVTELSGRGVGMDVVRAEVNAMGGRIETATSPGQGTRLRLLLPLTTAVTQVVMLRCGELSVAVPSTLIEIVRRLPSAEVEQAYARGELAMAGEDVPFFWLPALLQQGGRGEVLGRTQPVVVVRSAAQRVALHVDEVTANQEVVVKNVGSQLARLPGLAGVTLLPSGAVALIYNPVALATLYGDDARRRALGLADASGGTVAAEVLAAPPRAPLVLVVDDSLTVRRVTQRLLVREGYRVSTAKDGLDALEKLADERPAVLLSDIEMPRMDGFDLLRNVRADPALAGLPVVMITSRTAQKHRELAAALGANHYLGKPYGEEELLSLVAQHAGAVASDIQT
jgi:chemosensory pili system protein ChpA (sensor histidine kinase/response regulator)